MTAETLQLPKPVPKDIIAIAEQLVYGADRCGALLIEGPGVEALGVDIRPYVASAPSPDGGRER